MQVCLFRELEPAGIRATHFTPLQALIRIGNISLAPMLVSRNRKGAWIERPQKESRRVASISSRP